MILSSVDERPETLEGLVPGRRSGGARNRPELEGIADDGPHLAVGADAAEGHGLDEDVADGRRFGRAGHDRAARRVGRELAEEAVPRAAADDMDPLDGVAEDMAAAGR